MRPRSLDILGRPYRILCKKLKGNLGECRTDAGQLLYVRGQEAYALKDTILHEAMHAILYQQNHEGGEEVEERYVRCLATGTLALLRANPEFTAWLLEDIST